MNSTNFNSIRKICTKTSPTNENYTKILNIGYSKINEQRTTFSCFIGNCRFKSFNNDRFQNHLNNFHKYDKEIQQQKCLICKKFECGKSLKDEFDHLIDHIEKPEQFKAELSNDKQTLNIEKEIQMNEKKLDEKINEKETENSENEMQTNFVESNNENEIQSNKENLEIEKENLTNAKENQKRKEISSNKKNLNKSTTEKETLAHDEITQKIQPMRKAKLIENIKKEPENVEETKTQRSSKRQRKNISKDDSTTNDDDEEEKPIQRKRRKIVTSNSFKKEAKIQVEFHSLKDFYPWIEDENMKKTIFKTKNGIETLLSENCQFSTFKCMNDSCCYYTTDFDDFKRHLIREHIDTYNHYCSFCLLSFKKPAELCSHIDLFHNLDRFQCSHCMYRASQKGYVFEHQKKFHADQTCTILKSPVQKLSKSYLNRVKNDMIKNRETFVSAYHCKTPQCKENFFCKISFIEHLNNERAEFGEIVDDQLTEISSSVTHGFTQCLYCKFGTDGDDILSHLALNHQSKLAFICKRVKPSFICARQTLVTHTSIEYLGGHPADMKTFEGDLSELTNDMELVLIEKPIETIVVDDDDD